MFSFDVISAERSLESIFQGHARRLDSDAYRAVFYLVLLLESVTDRCQVNGQLFLDDSSTYIAIGSMSDGQNGLYRDAFLECAEAGRKVVFRTAATIVDPNVESVLFDDDGLNAEGVVRLIVSTTGL